MLLVEYGTVFTIVSMNIQCFMMSRHMARGIQEYMNKRKLMYAFSLWLAVSLLFHCTGLALPNISVASRRYSHPGNNPNPRLGTTQIWLDNYALNITSSPKSHFQNVRETTFNILTTDFAFLENIREIGNSLNGNQMSTPTPAKQGIQLTETKAKDTIARRDKVDANNEMETTTMVYIHGTDNNYSNNGQVLTEATQTQLQITTHEYSTRANKQDETVLNPIINTCRLQNELVYHKAFLKMHAAILGVAFIANIFLYIGMIKNIIKLFRRIIHPEYLTSASSRLKYGNANKTCNAIQLESVPVSPETHSSYHGRHYYRRMHREISNSAQLQVDNFLARPVAQPVAQSVPPACEPCKEPNYSSTKLHRMGERVVSPLRQFDISRTTDVPRRNTIANSQIQRLKTSISIVLAMTIVYCIFNAPQVIISSLLIFNPVPILDPGLMRWAVLFKVIQALFNVVVFLSKDKEARTIMKGICRCR